MERYTWMDIKSFWREKYALMRLTMRETRIKGIRMNAQETTVAMVGACLLPTMGLNCFVISLLYLVM
ncbi:hypothetical protein SLEP1_g33135 [Rubroshorea leprosula]|uniref:Uncharacterized protein n=1 Tax=Rubroshorea leprosula TaxID=152421 RepID=A0AAV5KFN5_9ROSI|nr:hypothetical protein SLEP1_g33135 [Rubroshorea leprosula]